MCHNGLSISALSDLSVVDTVDLAEAEVVDEAVEDETSEPAEEEDTEEEDDQADLEDPVSVVEEVVTEEDTAVEEVASPLPLLLLAQAGGRCALLCLPCPFRIPQVFRLFSRCSL